MRGCSGPHPEPPSSLAWEKSLALHRASLGMTFLEWWPQNTMDGKYCGTGQWPQLFQGPQTHGKVDPALGEGATGIPGCGSQRARGCPEATLWFSTHVNKHHEPRLRSTSQTSWVWSARQFCSGPIRRWCRNILGINEAETRHGALLLLRIQGVNRFDPRSSATDSGKLWADFLGKGLALPHRQEPRSQAQANMLAEASRKPNFLFFFF